MVKGNLFSEEELLIWESIHEHQKQGWIFRGQKDSGWGLETSLERACRNFERSLSKAQDIERILLREFKRKYHHYASHSPDNSYSLEWLSLMQHYGAPTRLLDFTYSIYVAAYFALENAKEKCAVWAINGNWAIRESAALFEERSMEKEFLIAPITEEIVKGFDQIFMNPVPKPFACPMNAFRLNERLTIQKGVFMCAGDVTLPFETNLRSLPNSNEKQNIVKLPIPRALRGIALESLSNMNISRATLFPGLDGFAQSLKISLPGGWDI